LDLFLFWVFEIYKVIGGGMGVVLYFKEKCFERNPPLVKRERERERV
jgi:hypothetical protein